MGAMKEHEDAYGRELLDQLEGRPVYEIVERDDGYIDAHPAAGYLAEYDQWSPAEQESMTAVEGRVLDIGCGAGRHALYLQGKGHSVVAIDVSPLAVEVCKRRGVRDVRVMSITEIDSSFGEFTTILMMGNNFGLFASERRAKRLLRRFHGMTSREGRIIAQARDPYNTDNEFHHEYHQRNRDMGRMGGQLRIRVRHQKYTSRWFDYLFVTPAEMEDLVAGTGWRLERVFGAEDPSYIAVLAKLELPSK